MKKKKIFANFLVNSFSSAVQHVYRALTVYKGGVTVSDQFIGIVETFTDDIIVYGDGTYEVIYDSLE